MLMEKTLFRFWKFCNRKWVKWPFITVAVIAITAAHFVMSAKYGDTEKAPSWEFTAMLHSALLVMAIIAIVIYKKYIKGKLIEYETDSGNKDN